MDVASSEIILDGLPMPHSPRLYGDELYLLLSATGELLMYHLPSKKISTLELGAFVRGMAEYGEHLFIGTSEIRKTSRTFNKLPIAQQGTSAGFKVVYKPTNSVVGQLEYLSDVHEIYDIQVLPGAAIPGMVTTENDIHQLAIVAPNLYFWKVPKKNNT